MICHFKGYIMNDTLFYAIEAMKKIANDELSGNDEVCKYIISALDELRADIHHNFNLEVEND